MNMPSVPRHAPFARALLGCALVAGTAHGARPLTTDDAGVTEVGRCQLDSYASHDRAHGERGVGSLALQGNCGAWDGSALGLAYAQAWDGEVNPQLWSLAGKTALGSTADDQPTYALSWGLGGRRPLGHAMRFDGAQVALIASVPVAAGWTLHANLGWSHAHETRASSTGIALAAEHQAADGPRFGIEFFANDRENGPWLQAGAAWPLAAGWLLNASIGTQLNTSRTRLVTLGVTHDF